MSDLNRFNLATPKGQLTQTDIWLTPPHIIEGMGGWEVFDLDPCAWLPEGSPLVRTAKNFFTEEMDGLSKQWYGNVFCNYPYSQSDVWMRKMAEHGNGVVLCFCRTETKAFQNNIKSATGMNLIKGRLKFLTADGKISGTANAPSCLIAWGEENYNRIKNIPGIYCRIDA